MCSNEHGVKVPSTRPKANTMARPDTSCKWCKTKLTSINDISIMTCEKCLEIPYVYQKIFGRRFGESKPVKNAQAKKTIDTLNRLFSGIK